MGLRQMSDKSSTGSQVVVELRTRGKLVGATNWFVRGPFMIEGLLCGLIGSVGAIILLLVGKQIVLPALPNWESDSADIQALAFELTALVILGAGLLLGAVGSALTLHRFLRV